MFPKLLSVLTIIFLLCPAKGGLLLGLLSTETTPAPLPTAPETLPDVPPAANDDSSEEKLPPLRGRPGSEPLPSPPPEDGGSRPPQPEDGGDRTPTSEDGGNRPPPPENGGNRPPQPEDGESRPPGDDVNRPSPPEDGGSRPPGDGVNRPSPPEDGGSRPPGDDVNRPSRPHELPVFVWEFPVPGGQANRSVRSLRRRESPGPSNPPPLRDGPEGDPSPHPPPPDHPGSSESDNQEANQFSVLSPSSRTVYSWWRDLGSGDKVREVAFTSDDSQIILFNSSDEALAEQDFTRVVVVSDWSTPNPLEVIIPFQGPCFLTSTNLTYQQALESLRVINGSTAYSEIVRRLDGTGRPMSREWRAEVYKSNPIVAEVCRNGILIQTVPEGTENPYAIEGPTETLNVSLQDSILHMKVPDFQPKTFNRLRSIPG